MGSTVDTGLNLATVWEAIARVTPQRPALIHGSVTTSWAAFEQRSASMAALLDEHGIGNGDNVALYLYNCSEYLEATFASFKVRAATVNVNYRYLESELEYLFTDSQAKAVVFHVEFADRLESIRSRLEHARVFICVGATSSNEVPTWALEYEREIATHTPLDPIERSATDRWLLYTGGTTGSPKGVIWTHAGLLEVASATFAVVKAQVPRNVTEVEAIALKFESLGKSVVLLPAAPLMHGTSSLTGLGVLSSGGTLVTLTSKSFDAHELWGAVQRDRVTQLTIVGDAFARPMLEALEDAERQGDPYDLSSLKVILSSGVMWSRESKEALHRWTAATLADSLGSSEGVGFAMSVSRPGAAAETASFTLGPNSAVFNEDGHRVVPGSGERGLLAVRGAIPLGYHNDVDKSAQTFRTFEGETWSVPGDFATVESDGTIRLLGRGSACINTAGEKVYPEEVEEILKLHPLVTDANVVGIPDEKWGAAVHAVVSLVESQHGGAQIEDDLRDHCRRNLAGYKCPKVIHFVSEVQRGPNGKPDYSWARGVVVSD